MRNFLALAAVLLAFAFSPAFADAPAQSDTQSRVNSTARLIAGLTPTRPDQMALAQLGEWRKHSAKMQRSWGMLRAGQVAPLMKWRDAALPKDCPVSDTLLYPFSGPDFFNVYWLFPNCDKYVLFGLEPIGGVPDVDKMNKEQFARLLLGVREAMANLFARNYFVTLRMDAQLKTEELDGVVPIIMISMVLNGLEVTSIEPLALDLGKSGAPIRQAAQEPAAPPLNELQGVTIKFRHPDSQRLQTLHYFSVDVSNKGLRHHPEFTKFLRDLGPTATLIKSASYLMHIDQFTRIRDLLLNLSKFLVQDDTGIPYSELTKRGWNMRVYGHYQEPIPPFERYFQRSLAEQYEINHLKPLPFHFGYRRSADGEERSNVMVGVRTAPQKPSGAAGKAVRPIASAQNW